MVFSWLQTIREAYYLKSWPKKPVLYNAWRDSACMADWTQVFHAQLLFYSPIKATYRQARKVLILKFLVAEKGRRKPHFGSFCFLLFLLLQNSYSSAGRHGLELLPFSLATGEGSLLPEENMSAMRLPFTQNLPKRRACSQKHLPFSQISAG